MFNAKGPGEAVRSFIALMAAAIIVFAALCAVQLFAAGEAKADTAAEAEYTIEKDESGRRMITSYSSGNTQTRFRIPDDVDGISAGAFKDVDSLEVLVLPDRFIRITPGAFSGCDRLKTVELEGGAVDGRRIYQSGLRPERFTASPGNTNVKIVDGVVYSWSELPDLVYNNMKELIAYPCGKAGDSFTVPEGVKIISGGAFTGSGLESIDLPKSLVNVDLSAFDYCSRLRQIALPNNVHTVWWSLLGCDSLERVSVPPHVTGINVRLGADIKTDLIISGKEGSRAESFAEEYGISFEAAEFKPYDQKIVTALGGKGLTMTYGDAPVKIGMQAYTTVSCSLSNSAAAGVVLNESPASYGGGSEPQDSITVKALKPGSTRVILKAEATEAFNAAETSFNVTVLKKPQKITTKKSSYNAACGKSAKLGASAQTKLTYKSSNTKVVKVSKSGKLTFIRPGKATVTVKAASTAYIAGAEKKISVKTYLAKPKLSAMAKSGKTKLSWKKVPAASQVQVYVKYPGKKKYEKVLTRSAKLRSVTHKGMKKGRVYRYKVRMRTLSGGRYVYSKYSNVIKVRAR